MPAIKEDVIEDIVEETGDAEEVETSADEGDVAEETSEEPEEEKPVKPKLFMSKSDRKATDKKNADKAAAKVAATQKKGLPDSVRTGIATKAKAEGRAEVEAEYQDWKDVPKEERARIRQLRDLGNQNPVALIDRFVREVHANPVYKAALEQYFASIGLVPKGSTPAASIVTDGDPMPKPDTPQGYSVDGLAKFNAWQTRQMMKEVDKRMAPLLMDRTNAAQRVQNDKNAESYAIRAVQSVMDIPGYKEALALPTTGGDSPLKKAFDTYPRPWITAYGTNYNHPNYIDEGQVLTRVVYAVTNQKATEAAQKKWIADQRKKAGINTVSGAGPGSGGASTQKKPLSFKEAVAREMKSGKYKI